MSQFQEFIGELSKSDASFQRAIDHKTRWKLGAKLRAWEWMRLILRTTAERDMLRTNPGLAHESEYLRVEASTACSEIRRRTQELRTGGGTR